MQFDLDEGLDIVEFEPARDDKWAKGIGNRNWFGFLQWWKYRLLGCHID